MKVAFDVKGTLEGLKGPIIIEILDRLASAGVETFVWSSLLSYAVDFVNEKDVDAFPISKLAKRDLEYDESQYMDFCIEDDRQSEYLASKTIIFVDEIESADQVVKMILEKKVA